MIQTKNRKEVMPIEMITGWMLPIYEFIFNGKLSKDRVEAKKLHRRSARYIIYKNALYRKGYSTPLLRYLYGEESERILKEIHK